MAAHVLTHMSAAQINAITLSMDSLEPYYDTVLPRAWRCIDAALTHPQFASLRQISIDPGTPRRRAICVIRQYRTLFPMLGQRMVFSECDENCHVHW